MNRELLELAAELSRRHQPFLTATVVWARGPSSGKRGSTAVIQPDGSVRGWIGGACAEPVVIRESREAMIDGRARLLFLGTEEDIAMVENRPDVTTVPISCTSEGALEVFLEPMLPAPHLVAIGGSPAVKTLVSLAETLGWRVDIVDEALGLPEISGSTAIVVATQGHYDEPAVEAALASDAGYIGLVASAKRAETVLGYLRDRGIDESQVARVIAPAGIDLGHIAHEEIGVSVVADLVKRRAAGELRGWPLPADRPHVAVDPVCEMEVEVASAKWIADHDGETYYFCAPGCKAAFERAPAEYAGV
ncbi:MAG: XdhC family protein [Acidimicrobiia bacterium]